MSVLNLSLNNMGTSPLTMIGVKCSVLWYRVPLIEQVPGSHHLQHFDSPLQSVGPNLDRVVISHSCKHTVLGKVRDAYGVACFRDGSFLNIRSYTLSLCPFFISNLPTLLCPLSPDATFYLRRPLRL